MPDVNITLPKSSLIGEQLQETKAKASGPQGGRGARNGLEADMDLPWFSKPWRAFVVNDLHIRTRVILYRAQEGQV